MTFWEQLTKLCITSGISPNKLCKDLGLSNATATHWKQGAKPSPKNIKLIADYFKMSEIELAKHIYTIELFDELEKVQNEQIAELEDPKNKEEYAKQLQQRNLLIQAYTNADKNIKQAINLILGIEIEI